MRVNPGNPDASYLVQKIEGTAAVGVRMPANGPPYLPQDRIDLVRRWIAAGAPQPAAPPDQLDRDQHAFPPCREAAAAGTRQTHRDLQRAMSTAHARAATPSTLRDASDQPVTLAGVRVPAGRRTWSSSPRQRRSPPAAISSPCMAMGPRRSPANAGHVLDGDADGKPGGDMLIPFDVSAGDAR